MVERIEINLLPAEYRVHRKTIRMQRDVVYPVMGVVVLAFVLMLYTFGLENQISQLRSDIARTEDSFRRNKPIKDEISRLKDDKKIIEGKIAGLERITVDRGKWVHLMENLCQRLPDFTWLVSCEEKEDALLIEGKTFSFPEVANFMSRLSESSYVKSVDLTSIEQKDASKSFSFIVSCKLNADAQPDKKTPSEQGTKVVRPNSGEVR